MLQPEESDFLRDRLSVLNRPGEDKHSLLARLVMAREYYPGNTRELPRQLDARADAADRIALRVARDAAALAAIGRAVYGAILEQLIVKDGGVDEPTFRNQLFTHFTQYGEATVNCDLNVAEELFPTLPSYLIEVLRETQAYVRRGNPDDFMDLRSVYQTAEVRRKSSRRARLVDTDRAAARRAEWNKGRHNTTPLHYRWGIVRDMLRDLNA